MSLHADAVRVLTEWTAPGGAPEAPEQDRLRRDYLGHLAAHPDGMWRSCGTGHLTASALVVDPRRGRVLLTLHRKLRMWLQMGGHCEDGDGSPHDFPFHLKAFQCRLIFTSVVTASNAEHTICADSGSRSPLRRVIPSGCGKSLR